jgi:hypothetical protein
MVPQSPKMASHWPASHSMDPPPAEVTSRAGRRQLVAATVGTLVVAALVVFAIVQMDARRAPTPAVMAWPAAAPGVPPPAPQTTTGLEPSTIAMPGSSASATTQ